MVRVGGVVIGRNEGERLKRCLRSLAGRVAPLVYVDSDASAGGLCEVPTLESNGTVRCEWAGTTLPGAQRSVQIAARFVGDDFSPLVNVTTVDSETSDPEGGNDTSAITVVPANNPLEVPTLGTSAMILLALGLGIAAMRRLRI